MTSCPSWFVPVGAKDGTLHRLRVPGGRLSAAQVQAIAGLADQLQITNRANLQIRGRQISWRERERLQELGLAHPHLDHLRNLMLSPMAGLDSQAIFNPWDLCAAWQACWQERPQLGWVSPKFSVGFDGGEQLSIASFGNDLRLSAEVWDGQVYLRVYVGGEDGGIVILPGQAIATLASFTQVYGEYCRNSGDQKPPRLRALISDWGLEKYLTAVAMNLDFEWRSLQGQKVDLRPSAQPVGISLQGDCRYVMGIGVPLGNLSQAQFSGVGAIASNYGNGEIRLTPWQNLMIPNLAAQSLKVVEAEVEKLGLSCLQQAIATRISACIGSRGCAAALSDTWSDATYIIEYLEQQADLRLENLTVHLSGCPKLCGQNSPRHLTLIATGKGEYQAKLS